MDDDLKTLILKTIAFYHHKDSGMFGGILGNKEASRRNNEIIELRKKLGLTNKQVAILVNKHRMENE